MSGEGRSSSPTPRAATAPSRSRSGSTRTCPTPLRAARRGVGRRATPGIDLGPLGYLGDARRPPPARLQQRGLALAGGYFEVPFSDPSDAARGAGAARRSCSTCSTPPRIGDGPPTPPPGRRWPTRARRAGRVPGAGPSDHSLGWDDAGWKRFADALARMVERCRERGYEPTFHPHTATYVEAPWEIDRLLECSDVVVCLDTGHLLIGGGDPVRPSATGARGSTTCTSRTPGSP